MPLTYKKIKRILDDFNFETSRSSGSHFRYEKNGHGLTVPFHKEFKTKTAKSILLDVSKICKLEYRELIDKYNIKI